MNPPSPRRVSPRELTTWIAILALITLLSYSISQDPHNHDHQLGQPAPPLALLSPQGQPVELPQFLGRTTVLNIYATWCPPCRQEIPDLAAFHQHLQSQANPDTQLFGVVFESGPPQEAIPASQQLGINYPIFFGTPLTTQNYDLHTYPTTLIISPQGILQARHEGILTLPQLQRLLQTPPAP